MVKRVKQFREKSGCICLSIHQISPQRLCSVIYLWLFCGVLNIAWKNLQCAIWRIAFTSSPLLVWTLWAVSVCFSQARFRIVSRLGAPQSLQSSCWSDAWQNMKTNPDAGSRQMWLSLSLKWSSFVKGYCTSMYCVWALRANVCKLWEREGMIYVTKLMLKKK